MENLDDMKTLWQELDHRIAFLEEENKRMARSVKENNYKSAQDKLISKYRKFIILEIIMIIWVLMFVMFNPLISDKYRIVLAVYWCIFFLIEVTIDSYLLLKTKEINIYENNIRQTARQAASNWKIHKITLAIGLPLAFGAVILFALALDANQYMMMGIMTGGIIGLIIGIKQLIKFRQYYRQLQSE